MAVAKLYRSHMVWGHGWPQPEESIRFGNIDVTKLYEFSWVPKGNLAGVCWHHQVVLELVCRADRCRSRHCKMSPVAQKGFGTEFGRKTGGRPTNKFPDRLPSGT